MSQLPFPNLQFDAPTAEAAISALQSAHVLLSDQNSTRQALAKKALDNWVGRYADQFRDDLDNTVSVANFLLEQITQTIRAISGAVDAASSQAHANTASQQSAAAPPQSRTRR